MQWLAFEPEHALIFARPRREPPPGHGDGPPRHEEEFLGHDMLQSAEPKGPPPACQEPGHEPNRKPPPPTHHDDKLGPKPKRPFHPQYPRPVPPHHPHYPPPHDERPGPPPGHRLPPPKHHEPPPPGHHNPQPLRLPPPHHERRSNSQQPLRPHHLKQESNKGYLHTYVPNHPLRLLYVDGLSAGKTSNGTLDTQDTLLLNLTDAGGPMGGEFDRAVGMCNLISTLWGGNIDGILRMKGGFEIILCDFEKHLEIADVITVPEDDGHNGPGGLQGGWQYIKAIASRYHSIGGDRVRLEYQDFVSVFAYLDVDDLFTNDVQSDYAMPRLQNVKDADLLRIRDDVTDMILRKDWTEEKETTNWQAVADAVVQRYSAPLHHVHIDQQLRKDKDKLAAYLAALLRPFIDYTARNATLETDRCVCQFVPLLRSPSRPAASLAHRTVHTITHHICDTLLTSLSIAASSTPHSSFTSVYASHAAELVDELVKHLQWTAWKQCGTCADEEVCFIPIWPMGTHEDHAQPKCLDEEGASGRRGYWGSRWGQGLPREGGKEPWEETRAV